jgi:hypothetical protein
MEIISVQNGIVTLANRSTNSLGGHSDVSWSIAMPQYVTPDATGKLKKFQNRYVLPAPIYKRAQLVKFSDNRNNTGADYWPILPGPWWVVLIANDVTYSGQYPVTNYRYCAVQITKDESGQLLAGNIIGHDEVIARKLHLLVNEAKSEENRAINTAIQTDASLALRRK